MKHIRINTFLIIILSQLFFQLPINSISDSMKVDIHGYVKTLNGNYMPRVDNYNRKYIYLPNQKIVAVPGHVESISMKRMIPFNLLPSTFHETYSNDNGKFNFHLKPGIYTFFIIKNNQAYLNKFDGKGNFMSTEVDMNTNHLLLLDDSKANY